MENKKVSKFLKIFDPHLWFYDFVRLTGILPIMPFYRTKKIYVDKQKGLFKGDYIICSNHPTYNDPAILLTALTSRRPHFVVAKEVCENKFVNLIFKGFGCVKIDRQNPSLATFQQVKKKIEWGHPVVVFPEEHVNTTDELLDFKSGIIMMAVLADVPILPVYIAKRYEKSKRQIVVIGTKLNWKEYCSGPIPTIDEMNKLAQVLKDKEIELKLKYKERVKD